MEMNEICKILINTSVYAPIMGAILLAMFFPFFENRGARVIGVGASIISFVSAIVLWFEFAGSYSVGITFASTPVLFGIPLAPLGVNAISMPMLALAGIVGFASALWASRTDIGNARLYFLLLLVMQGGLMGAFATTNVLWMYMFHEFALVPTFVATILWGGAGKRMASMQMAIYLTLGALISLVGIIALYAQLNASHFNLYSLAVALAKSPLSADWQYKIFGLLLFGLGTLVSLFPFYSWAPRAYSAAPTSFAMLHAGVLKKFGLYVLIQVGLPFLAGGCLDWSKVMAILALFNVIFIGLVTMAQKDLKLMISYSSVAHMGLCFLGIATMSVLGIGGAILLMFGHGVSVALLFMLSNAIVNRSGQWDMSQMGGLYKQTPVLASFFLAGTLASLGLPMFANFWGELTILTSLWDFSPTICALGATGLVISAIYGLRGFANIFMGSPSEKLSLKIRSIEDLNWKEKLPAVVLLSALLFVGFCPSSITESLNANLSQLLTTTIQSK